MQVRRDAEGLPGALSPGVLLKHFPEVEASLNRFTDANRINIDGFFIPMQGTGWHSLDLLDAILSAHGDYKSHDRALVCRILDEVSAIIDEVRTDPDLEVDLRRYLLTRLHEVEQALIDSAITGTQAIEFATNALWGARHGQPDIWDRIARTKWAPRIAGVWAALCATLAALGGLPALMPGVEPTPVVQNHVTVEVEGTSAPAPEGASDAQLGETVPDEDSSGTR